MSAWRFAKQSSTMTRIDQSSRMVKSPAKDGRQTRRMFVVPYVACQTCPPGVDEFQIVESSARFASTRYLQQWICLRMSNEFSQKGPQRRQAVSAPLRFLEARQFMARG